MHTWIFLVSLVGCGGSDKDGDSVPATGTSTGTSETSTTTGSTTPSTWECNPWYPCQECGGAECGAEINACAGDAACGPALNAWAECVLDCGYPTACAEVFVDDGGSAADALHACTVARCADVCDLEA